MSERRWPKPLPKWFWPWLRWYLGEGEYKGRRRDKSSRPFVPDGKVPGWAWDKKREFLAARRKSHPLPPAPPLVVPPADPRIEFWQRMGVWITRIDHFPVEWLPQYARDEYPIVIVPCLFGTQLEVDADELRTYIKTARDLGYLVVGSQWGKATDAVSAQYEASVGATQCNLFGFDGWVMNGEKLYEEGGESAAYAREFRRRLPKLPLGWSPEPWLDLDHDVLRELAVVYMPQAYPLENYFDVAMCLDTAKQHLGYDPAEVVCLVQAYPSPDGRRYDPLKYREQARSRGARGLILYAGNQAADVPDYWRELVI